MFLQGGVHRKNFKQSAQEREGAQELLEAINKGRAATNPNTTLSNHRTGPVLLAVCRRGGLVVDHYTA